MNKINYNPSFGIDSQAVNDASADLSYRSLMLPKQTGSVQERRRKEEQSLNIMTTHYLQMTHRCGYTQLKSDAFGRFTPLSGRDCSACLLAALLYRLFPSVQLYWISHRKSKWAGVE